MSRVVSVAFAGVSLLAALLQAGIAHAQQAMWLDQTLTAWTRPNDPVPPAPAPPGVFQPQCTKYERASNDGGPSPSAEVKVGISFTGDEESQVAAAGWRLETYWPSQRKGDLAAVLATAGYDGMCRPWRFNGFMFYRGRFAGTLSPVSMNSREDGVLAQDLSLPSDHELDAQFIRYAASDPLCCPSLGRTKVVFNRHEVAGAQLMVPEKAFPVSTGQHSAGWLGLELPQILAFALAGILLAVGGGGTLVRRRLASRGTS